MSDETLRNVNYLKIDWKGNNVRDASGAQSYVISNLQEGQFPILSYTCFKGRLWGALTFEEIVRVAELNHGIYEILIPDCKRKIYFDVDKTSMSLNEVKEIILRRFPDARQHISGRDGSWHIILSNYYADNLEKMWPIRRFAAENGFDKSVYYKNKNFKCVNQSKPREPLQAFVEGSREISKHLILHDFDEDAINISSIDFGYGEQEVPPSKSRKKTGKVGDAGSDAKPAKPADFDILDIPQGNAPIPAGYESTTALPIDKLAILPNPPRNKGGRATGSPLAKRAYHHDHTCCWKIMTWCKNAALQFEQFWAWNKKKDPSVHRYKRYLKAWNNPVDYKVSYKLMDVLLERYYPEINVATTTTRFKEQFDLENVSYVDNPYLQHSNISTGRKNKFSLLASPMGSNKTGAVVDFICKKGKARVLWITPRITLAENTLWRLREAGLKVSNYRHFSNKQKKQGALDNQNILICSIQSIHYLNDDFDIIVVDEIETVFGTFNGDAKTHKGGTLLKNWNVFMGFLHSAKKVIFMDAFITKLTTNFVSGICKGQSEMGFSRSEIVNTNTPPRPRRFLEMKTFKLWLDHIMDALAAGKKIYIFTPKKCKDQGISAITNTILKTFDWKKNEQIFTYCSEYEEEKRNLDDVENLWGKESCRCVVTTATISVGVNFDRKDVFDCIYGYYTPFIPVRDFVQSLNRVRHPKSDTMILLRDRKRVFGQKIDPDKPLPECPIYQRMVKDLEIERLAGSNYKDFSTFEMFCQIANIEIIPESIETALAENTRRLCNYTQRTDVVFNYHCIANIDSTTSRQLTIKTYNNTANMDDRLQLEKYYFKRKFKEDADEFYLSQLWSQKRDFIDKFHILQREEDHIINRVLADNNVVFGDKFPVTMTNKIPHEEIHKCLKFDRRVQNLQSGLVAQMLNAFFGMSVYSCDKRVRNGEGREYEYATSEQYLYLAEYCLLVGKKLDESCENEAIQLLL